MKSRLLLCSLVLCASAALADTDQEIADAHAACQKFHIAQTRMSSAEGEWMKGHEKCAVVQQKYEAAEIVRKAKDAADEALINKVGEKK